MDTLLVTGCDHGLGVEVAGAALQAGYRVFAGCLKPARAAGMRALARGSGDRLAVFGVDMGSERSVRRAAAWVGRRTRSLDVLVNNAGIYRTDGTFDANFLMAKCPSKYEMSPDEEAPAGMPMPASMVSEEPSAIRPLGSGTVVPPSCPNTDPAPMASRPGKTALLRSDAAELNSVGGISPEASICRSFSIVVASGFAPPLSATQRAARLAGVAQLSARLRLSVWVRYLSLIRQIVWAAGSASGFASMVRYRWCWIPPSRHLCNSKRNNQPSGRVVVSGSLLGVRHG